MDRREVADRRTRADRRTGRDRRTGGERRQGVVLVPVERRADGDRRDAGERRSDASRRDADPRRGPDSVGEHLRNALQLLTDVAESGTLDDATLRDLDAAMFRLRFALDRLEGGSGKGAGAA